MDRRIYGYVRISTPKQNIDRQVRNIKKIYPDAIIIKEIYTGSTLDRPEWKRVIPKILAGSLIVFDSVSRMARNADEGVADYFELFDRGIELEFLVEHYIDTAVYRENIKDKIALMGTDEDEIIKGINNYFRKIAEKQIRIAFEQAEKELDDLHQRTREGIETARLAGKQIGQLQGRKLNVKKAATAKEIIKLHSREYGGSLLVAGITTGTAMNNYWGRAENDAYIGIIALTGMAFVVAVLAGIAIRGTWKKWLPCYFFSFVAVCAFSVIESNWPILICLTALLLLTKILTRFAEGGLRALDVIVTSLYCIELLANGKEIPYAYLLLAGTILSMFLVYGWTTIQELLLTFSLAFFAAANLMPMLKLPAFAGILFVSILLFNNVKYMRGKNILVFNVSVDLWMGDLSEVI